MRSLRPRTRIRLNDVETGDDDMTAAYFIAREDLDLATDGDCGKVEFAEAINTRVVEYGALVGVSPQGDIAKTIVGRELYAINAGREDNFSVIAFTLQALPGREAHGWCVDDTSMNRDFANVKSLGRSDEFVDRRNSAFAGIHDTISIWCAIDVARLSRESALATSTTQVTARIVARGFQVFDCADMALPSLASASCSVSRLEQIEIAYEDTPGLASDRSVAYPVENFLSLGFECHLLQLALDRAFHIRLLCRNFTVRLVGHARPVRFHDASGG